MRRMASDGLGDDVRVIKGGRVGVDVYRVAGEDLRWPVQGGGHDDEGVRGCEIRWSYARPGRSSHREAAGRAAAGAGSSPSAMTGAVTAPGAGSG